MQKSSYSKAGLLALAICSIALISWEIHLRNAEAPISYDDDEALWADKRAMVYEPGDRATVFIGTSRIKYDIDIPTWQSTTGDHAIQLANVGSSPRPVLADLASDPNFKGRVIVDVVEGLFFSEGAFYDWKTKKKIAYFKERTPTQRFGFQVNHVMESQFAFLNQDYYSLNAMLDNAHFLPPREGVFPGLPFPMEFEPVTFDRQSYMTPRFVADTNLQNQVKAIWGGCGRNARPPISSGAVDTILMSVKSDVDKIKARGGQVLFIRPPSSGLVRMGEMKAFPRAAFWDRLLTVTGCQGVFYSDYPAIANFECPEWSHLSPDQAAIYTKNLIKILQEEKGWTFNKKST